MSYFLRFTQLFAASLLLAFSFFAANTGMAQSASTAGQLPGAVHIEYHFPMDGSTYVPTHSSIIIRPNVTVSPSAMMSDLKVTGAASGVHTGSIVQSDDKRTLVFIPSEPFNLGEKVTVVIQNNSSTGEGAVIQPISFSFNASPSEPARDDGNEPYVGNPGGYLNLSVDTIPTPVGFPTMEVLTDNNPAPGDIFMTSFNFNGTKGGYFRMIIDSLAQPIYAEIPSNGDDWDFKVLPNGNLAFCEGGYTNGSIIGSATKYYIMDSNFDIIDTFATQTDSSQYVTDFHDIELLPNGHMLMLGQFVIPNWNMSIDVPNGGLKDATLLTAVIEEIDNSIKQPVWIWRAWDPGHFHDTDATNDPFTEQQIDAVHANAIMQDTDGNILLSSRSMDEITKIDRTGSDTIIWRLGGKHNQFKFINDNIMFSHQHAIRRIANGDLTLFDNGNFGHDIMLWDSIGMDSFPTKYARACEYRLNLDSMTATLVWHFDHDSTQQSTAMGYVQRLPDSNTLINWGENSTANGLTPQPAITEVRPDGTIAYELYINTPIVVYRAEKFIWNRALSSVATSTNVPSGLILGSPFPNPSSGNSQVVFSSPPLGPVQLELYDPLGRMVRSYFDGPAGAQITPLQLDTQGLPDGSYQLVLRGSGGVVSRQLNILR